MKNKFIHKLKYVEYLLCLTYNKYSSSHKFTYKIKSLQYNYIEITANMGWYY